MFLSFFLCLTIRVFIAFCKGFLRLHQVGSTLPGGGFSSCDVPALGQAGFSSCSTWAWLLAARGNLPGAGTEPLPPALQAASYPLHHQGSRWNLFLKDLKSRVNMSGYSRGRKLQRRISQLHDWTSNQQWKKEEQETI